MNADICRGLSLYSGMYCQNTSNEMSNFYLSSINLSLHFFTANIISGTFASDLHVTEHATIHQHVLKQWLFFQKKSCQSCLHCLHVNNIVYDWLNLKPQKTIVTLSVILTLLGYQNTWINIILDLLEISIQTETYNINRINFT